MSKYSSVRTAVLLLVACSTLVQLALPASVVPGSIQRSPSPSSSLLDPSFAPQIGTQRGSVQKAAAQSDGKIIVAGSFKQFNGFITEGVARLNTDNTIDQNFKAALNGAVSGLAIQADGKMIVAGTFTAVDGVSRQQVARLNADGSLDESFVARDAPGLVNDIAVQPDGKIILVGTFSGSALISSTTYIVRLNTDGSIDPDFTSPIATPHTGMTPANLPTNVSSVAIDPNGKIILGGNLYTNYDFPSTVRNSVLRLNANGSLDPTFTVPNITTSVLKVVAQSDGRILIGGPFTTVSGTSRRFIARLNPNGSLDTTFDAGTEAAGTVNAIYVDADGKVLFGGTISTGQSIMKRLNPTGSLDVAFAPQESFAGQTLAIVPASGGKYLVAGSLTSTVDAIHNNTAVIFGPDYQDMNYRMTSVARGIVFASAVQTDGKIVIGGTFDWVNDAPRLRLARLNQDGSLDTTFAPSFSATHVNALYVQPDGKILVGGWRLVSGNGPYMLMRFNADGTRDTSFTLPTLTSSDILKSIAVQSDGKIVYAYNKAPNGVDFPAGGVVRLNADGTTDTSFSCSLLSPWETVATLPNGQVLVGGPLSISYTTGTTTETHVGLLRLNANGTHDRTFRSGLLGDSSTGRFSRVSGLYVQKDGRILVGGTIYTTASTSSTAFGIARLDSLGNVDNTFQVGTITSDYDRARVLSLTVLPDSKIVATGLFKTFGGSPHSNVVRLQADGTLDTGFAEATDRTVYSGISVGNGDILIGGEFDKVDGTPQTSFARIHSGAGLSRRVLFDFDGDGKSDVSIYRPGDSAQWWVLRSSDGVAPGLSFGTTGDITVPADFTGDGKTDIAVYRPSTGTWYILRSEDSLFYGFPFGSSTDVPAPADYDGDGKADAAVFRSGAWYILRSSDGGVTSAQFGLEGDKPVPADFDGDGKADIAIYRPNGATGGEWWALNSSGGVFSASFGNSTDKVTVGDWTGDGKADCAFFRPSNATWYILRSEDNLFYGFPFGNSTDTPAPGDFDGDGKMDAAVFRPSQGAWYILGSTSGFSGTIFGVGTDQPVEGSFVR